MTKQKWFIAFFLILIFSGNTFAQEIQAIPITPPIQPPQPAQPIPSQQLQPQAPAPEGVTPQAAPQPTQPRPVEVERLSEFEQFISGKTPLTVSTDIKQFGYDLFKKPPSTFAPVEKVPVGPEYVIGPGDEIRITIWGRIEGQWNVVVDRDGNIALPKVGILGVTGLTFKELKEVLHREFSKYYTGFEMNVSMGALRTIRVYVVGNAEIPGAYTVSSLSTIVNALFEAGGPSKTGTMRDIQVKRNGKTFVHFDLYDFLLKGDKTKDTRLMPEDVIFIPSIGHLAGIAGNVKQPAIYELKGETRLLDLIRMAGGLSSVAFKGRVQVQRIEDHKFRTIFEGDLIEVENNPEKNFVLMDGDLLKVFPIVEVKNTIKISGAVANPGEYGVKTGVTRVKDVLSLAGGLLYYASNQAEITRVKVTQAGPQTERISLDLSKALQDDPQHNIPLEINDYLFVRTVPEWDLYKIVSITGEVKFPGTYTIKKGERLSSLIERAGGYTDKAYLRGAIFTREKVKEIQQKSLDEMINRLERELLSAGATLSSTALTSEEIQISRIELEQRRKFIESLKTLKPTGRMSIRLAHLRLLKNSEFDIELEEGDSLFIPIENKVVNVTGAVFSPGSFVYHSEFDYRDYVDQAAGFSRYADTSNVYVLKVDGTAKRLSKGFLGWNPFQNRWEVLALEEEKEIEPGDTIVVPEEPEKIAWLREVKDITQILFQIAVTTGVVLRLF